MTRTSKDIKRINDIIHQRSVSRSDYSELTDFGVVPELRGNDWNDGTILELTDGIYAISGMVCDTYTEGYSYIDYSYRGCLSIYDSVSDKVLGTYRGSCGGGARWLELNDSKDEYRLFFMGRNYPIPEEAFKLIRASELEKEEKERLERERAERAEAERKRREAEQEAQEMREIEKSRQEAIEKRKRAIEKWYPAEQTEEPKGMSRKLATEQGKKSEETDPKIGRQHGGKDRFEEDVEKGKKVASPAAICQETGTQSHGEGDAIRRQMEEMAESWGTVNPTTTDETTVVSPTVVRQETGTQSQGVGDAIRRQMEEMAESWGMANPIISEQSKKSGETDPEIARQQALKNRFESEK